MSGVNKIAFDQRLARAVVRPLARTPISPNALTAAAMAVGLGAAWMFAQGDRASASWGGALFMVAVWMDHCDGELARLKNQTSAFGHYFDHAAALTTYVALFVGVGIGLSGGRMDAFEAACGVVAGLAVAAVFGLRIWVEERVGRHATRQTTRGGFQVEDILYVVGPIAWLDLLQPFIVAAAVGAPIFLIVVIWEAFARKSGRGAP